jgi:hypothetical protein
MDAAALQMVLGVVPTRKSIWSRISTSKDDHLSTVRGNSLGNQWKRSRYARRVRRPLLVSPPDGAPHVALFLPFGCSKGRQSAAKPGKGRMRKIAKFCAG